MIQKASAALSRLGGLDVVVNNAGYIWNTTVQKTTDEQLPAMLDVHATAPFRVLRAAGSGLLIGIRHGTLATHASVILRKVVLAFDSRVVLG